METKNNMKNIVSIKNLKNNQQNSIKECLNQIQWTNIIKKDDRIALKINLCTPLDKEGVTVRPTLLKQICEVLQSRCSELYICESNGSNFSCEDAFQNCGIYRIAKDTGANPINLSKSPSIYYKFKNFRINKLQMPKLLFNCDHFLTLAVLKTHVYTTVSLGLKNQFGCIPSAKRFLLHPILNDIIVKLNQILKPSITFIDGVYGLNFHGPLDGTPIKLDYFISSNNVVAADYIGSLIMGFNPFYISHIQKAIDSILGIWRPEELLIYGDYRKFINYFTIKHTLIDKLTLLTLKSNIINQLILNTPFTPIFRFFSKSLTKNPLSAY